MNASQSSRAALKVVAIALILAGTVAVYGCAAPTMQMPSPGTAMQATAMPTSGAMATAAGTPTTVPVTDQELATLGCVCHFQVEEGAPPVSQIAPFPPMAITQHVRRGPGTMPAWNTQSLSDQLLARIINFLKSAPQATPTPAVTPTP